MYIYVCVWSNPSQRKSQKSSKFFMGKHGGQGSSLSTSGQGGFLFFFFILGTIETMKDSKGCWIETSPSLVSKSSHAMLRKEHITVSKRKKCIMKANIECHMLIYLHTANKKVSAECQIELVKPYKKYIKKKTNNKK